MAVPVDINLVSRSSIPYNSHKVTMFGSNPSYFFGGVL